MMTDMRGKRRWMSGCVGSSGKGLRDVGGRGLLLDAANVRRDVRRREMWRRVGVPRQVSLCGGLPLFSFEPFGDGRVAVLLFDGHTLYRGIRSGGSYWSDIVEVAELDGEPLMAFESTPGFVRLLMKHRRDRYLGYDSDLNFTYYGEMPALPEIGLRAGDFTSVSVSVSGRKLTGMSAVRNGSSLSAADTSLLTSDLLEGYARLKGKVAAEGFCLQPAVARYRLVDASGCTLATGPTVLLTSPTGFQCCDVISLESTDNLATTGGCQLTAQVYRPQVVSAGVLPSPWNRLVAGIVVDMGEELDPVDGGLQSPSAIRVDQSGQVSVGLYLPGTSVTMVPSTAARRRLVVAALCERLREVASIGMPFDGGLGDVAGESVGIVPSSGGCLAPAGVVRSEVYSCGGRVGDLTVLCNPLREGFQGWKPGCFAASVSSKPLGWRACASVRIKRGGMADDVAVALDSGLSGGPTGFSPLLCYPSTDATSITLTVELRGDGLSGTTVVTQTYPLTPLAEAGMAYYLSPDLLPIMPSVRVDGFSVVQASVKGVSECGVAVVFGRDRQLEELDRRRISDWSINAVVEAPRSQSSWDFSRQRVLLLGDSGVYIATVGGSGAFHSVAVLDRRRVVGREAVAEVVGSEGAGVVAICGGDLVSIGRQRVRTLLSGCGASRVGCSSRYGEVWLSGGVDGRLRRFTTDGEEICVEIDDILSDVRFCQWGGGLLLSAGGRVFDAEDEVAVAMLRVRLRERFAVGGRLRLWVLNLFGWRVAGTAELSGDNGTEVPERLLMLDLEGELNAPLRSPLAVPRREFVEVRTDVAVSPDFSMLPVVLKV